MREFMKIKSTLVLRGLIILMCLGVLTMTGLMVYGMVSGDSGIYTPILFGMYLTLIPFFFGVYYVLKLLGYIDKNKAFSGASNEALQRIKFSAGVIALMYAAGLPYIYFVADKDDAPGVILIGMFFVFGSLVVATVAAVSQKVLRSVK
jgi:hypothetical protein